MVRNRMGRVARPLKRSGALAGVLAMAGLSMVLPIGPTPPSAHADVANSAVTVSHPIVDGKGLTYPGASVTVSQTKDIQQRQVINVSWRGVEASRGYNLTQNSAEYDPTTYPVVILECWGTDTGGDNGMDPRHCQGSPHYQHTARNRSYPVTNDPQHPNPSNDVKQYLGGAEAILGFEAVDHSHFGMSSNATGADGIPPSLQDGSDALPSNAVLTWSAGDPKGSGHDGHRENVEFEVRGGSDLPVLGCSATQACTLEVIPIVQPWCNPKDPSPINRYYCNRPVTQPIGPDGQGGFGNSLATGGSWWLTSEWKNRFSIPFSMAPQPGECPVVDQRPTASLTGSEAATVAMGSWGPHFCLDQKSNFKLTHVNTPEDTARRALTTNDGVAYSADGIFTTFPVTGSPRPVVHAPVAVTGWTVGYKVDDAKGAAYTNLTLSPLLLAKLMTESYSGRQGAEPALAGNPYSLFDDPEFQAINPGFHPDGATMGSQLGHFTQVIWDVNPSDAFGAMFAYINADPEARAWLNGKPDGFSQMVVNPAYRSLPAPQMEIQLLDNWVMHGRQDGAIPCEYSSPIAWYSEIGQLANSLENASIDVLNRKPQYQVCKSVVDSNGKSVNMWAGNKDSSNIGKRDLIAFTTVPLAEKYGMNLARLQSHLPNSKSVQPAGWENPTNDPTRFDSILASLGYTKQDKDTGVVSPDFSVFPFSGAYAGVMPVYAAIPTSGLDTALAAHYAEFLEFAAGAGQTPGYGAGQLPPGYAPMPTAYSAYTRQLARAVRDQKGAAPAPPNDLAAAVRNELGLPQPAGAGFGESDLAGGTPGGGSGDAAALGSSVKALNTGGNTPAASGSPSGAPKPGAAPPGAKVTTVATTRGAASWWATWGLPLLLGIGVLAGLAVPVVRLVSQPGHPVRVVTAQLMERTQNFFSRLRPRGRLR